MNTRHRIDTLTLFDRTAAQPPEKAIEIAEQWPVPRSRPKTATVRQEVYRVGAELEGAVNLAIKLGRPLLLQGDPGCGKTQLSYAVAYALGRPIEAAYVKSSTRAQDLLYTYDAVRRLYDAQMAPRSAERARSADVMNYIRFGPLGRAIVRAQYKRPSVVLIDEIDKADLDFPNDLLRELDRLEFEVTEGTEHQAHAVPRDRPELRPIIFVTHNEEKALPAAFLRRCVYHYVEFPNEQLDAILASHQLGDAALRAKAIEVVMRLRKRDLLKKPGLSELLDWVGYLSAAGITPDEVDALPGLGSVIKNQVDLKPALDEFPSARLARGTTGGG